MISCSCCQHLLAIVVSPADVQHGLVAAAFLPVMPHCASLCLMESVVVVVYIGLCFLPGIVGTCTIGHGVGTQPMLQ